MRSYVAPGTACEPCPVCGSDLRTGAAAPDARRSIEGRGPTDAALVARHRCGDSAAFGELHDRYARGLRSHARRVVGSAQCEDIVQEAFERAHRFVMSDARAVDTGMSLGAWLHVVVHRCCIDELRRAGRAVVVAEVDVPETAPGPHRRAEISYELGRLARAVHALPPRQREALVRHALDGESHATVAGRLEVSVSATKGLVNRARRELRHSAAA